MYLLLEVLFYLTKYGITATSLSSKTHCTCDTIHKDGQSKKNGNNLHFAVCKTKKSAILEKHEAFLTTRGLAKVGRTENLRNYTFKNAQVDHG